MSDAATLFERAVDERAGTPEDAVDLAAHMAARILRWMRFGWLFLALLTACGARTAPAALDAGAVCDTRAAAQELASRCAAGDVRPVSLFSRGAHDSWVEAAASGCDIGVLQRRSRAEDVLHRFDAEGMPLETTQVGWEAKLVPTEVGYAVVSREVEPGPYALRRYDPLLNEIARYPIGNTALVIPRGPGFNVFGSGHFDILDASASLVSRSSSDVPPSAAAGVATEAGFAVSVNNDLAGYTGLAVDRAGRTFGPGAGFFEQSLFSLAATESGFFVYGRFRGAWGEPHDGTGPASGPIVQWSEVLAEPGTNLAGTSVLSREGRATLLLARGLADGTASLELVDLDPSAHPAGSARRLFHSPAAIDHLQLVWAAYSYLAVFSTADGVYALRVCP